MKRHKYLSLLSTAVRVSAAAFIASLSLIFIMYILDHKETTKICAVIALVSGSSFIISRIAHAYIYKSR